MSLDLEQLQHEILEAESYLQSNVSISTDLRERDASRRSISYSSTDGITELRKNPTYVPVPSTTVAASGRYSDPVEREQLIQRLLRERDQSRQKVEENNTVYDNAATKGVGVGVGINNDRSPANIYFTSSTPPSSTFAISPEKSASSDQSRGSNSAYANNLDNSPSSPMIFYASDVLSGSIHRSNMDFGHEIYGTLQEEDPNFAETVRFTRPVEPWIDRSYSPPTSMATLPDLDRQSTQHSEGSGGSIDMPMHSTSRTERPLQDMIGSINHNKPHTNTTTSASRSSGSYFNDISSSSYDNKHSKDDGASTKSASAKSASKYLKSRDDLIREADELFKATHSFKPALSATSPSATSRPASTPRGRTYLLSTKSSEAQRSTSASSSRSVSASRSRRPQQAVGRTPSRSRSTSRGRSLREGNEERTGSTEYLGVFDDVAGSGSGPNQSDAFTVRGRDDDDSLVRQSTTSSRNVLRSASPPTQQQQQPRRVASYTTSPYRSTSQRRIEEMYRLHEQKLRDRERLRLDLQKLELSECTFTPNISHSSTENILRHRSELNGSSQRETGSPHPIEASARLYKEAEERSSQQRWLEKKVTEARMAQYTFQPTIKKVPSAAEEGPIYERVAKLQRERRKRLEQLRESYEREISDQLTFKPQMIAKKSHKSSTENAESADLSALCSDVGYRLNEAGRLMSRRKQQLLVNKERDLLEAMEPAPVSKGTEKIAKNSEIVSAKFADRQELLAEKAKFREKQRNQVEVEKTESWFKPEIDTKSMSIIEKKRPELLTETATERAERMSRQEAMRLEERREKMTAEIYGNISFAPRIDALSKVLGKATDLEELSENNRGKHSREILRQKVELEESKECSFKPKINDLSKLLANSVSSPIHTPDSIGGMKPSKLYSKDDSQISIGRIDLKHPEKMALDIRSHLLQKEERRHAELIQREIEELKNCTFNPVVKPPPSRESLGSSEPIVIRGLGRYLELKQMSAKQKEDLKQRELDAFSVRNVDKFRRVEDGTTIVETFSFRTAKLPSNQKRARANAQ